MKIAQNFLLLFTIVFFTTGCHAKNIDKSAVKSEIKISTCGFDYDDENYFCKPEQKKIFENNLNQPADFNKEYKLIKVRDHDYYRLVLLNKKNKTIYPFHQQLAINNKLKFDYSINSDKICVSGDFEAYRDSYSNTKICFKLIGSNIEKDTITEISNLPNVKEISTPVDIDDYEICVKNKPEKICEKYTNQKYNTYNREKAIKLIPQLKKLDDKYQNFDFIKGENNLYVILTDRIGLDSGEVISYYTLVTINDDLKQITLGDWFKISKEKRLQYKDEDGKIKSIQLD